ncbi:type VII secretion protein EccB [Streptomyces venezuelae]|uniref:type VII secretion protein EccB n=1 Tax=Streptomyces venezuelae TaxID=54571 RepID=UPI0036303133
MASRRDELNAYTFAKKRTVAAFLQPSPSGTEEGAPRPLRAIVPGLIVAALVVAGFGAWGMFSPQAPKGWDTPGTRVIVGKQSTTRYVVLETGTGKDKKTLLHPVLNLASARLLLNPDQFQVVQVADKTLDLGKPPRGPILGIPYAPDRLPTADDAGKPKRWAVCEQPGGGTGASVQKATFLFAERDLGRTEGAGKLKDGEVMFVKGQKGAAQFLVDHTGTKYPVKAESTGLVTTLVGLSKKPQAVTDDWLATLKTGDEVDFPRVPGEAGAPAGVPGSLTATENRVGMVLVAETGSGPQNYVVLPGKVQPVTPFTARLLINSPQNGVLDMDGKAVTVDAPSFVPDPTFFHGGANWPKKRVAQVNATTDAGARDTVCNVLTGVDEKGATTLATWAGSEYPADITAGGTSTYVTPGTGLLYTQTQGQQKAATGGSLFLVTDTGLRYAVQSNGDSDSDRSEIGAGDKEKSSDGRPEPSDAQKRLGYEKVQPALVPIEWSEFLSKGPRLDTNSARQPQGS